MSAGEFEPGEAVWVTDPKGLTFATPFAYGPNMLEMFKGFSFSRERPPMNWASMVPEWMLQGYGPVEATNLRNQLNKMGVPCTPETRDAIHATMMARWYQDQCPKI